MRFFYRVIKIYFQHNTLTIMFDGFASPLFLPVYATARRTFRHCSVPRKIIKV